MKSTYTFANVCVILCGTVFAAPQGSPVNSALATCICNTEIFSLQDLTDALKAAVNIAPIPPAGNDENLEFPWCTGNPAFGEFPLLKPTFSPGVLPGAYRLIYDYIGQKICGCVKHLPVSTSEADFGLCDQEGDAPPSIINTPPPDNTPPDDTPPPDDNPPPDPIPLSPDPIPLSPDPIPPPNPIFPLPPPIIPGP